MWCVANLADANPAYMKQYLTRWAILRLNVSRFSSIGMEKKPE